MTFGYWLRQYTGLSLYDFRVLDLDGSSETEVRNLFNAWLEECKPIDAYITKAIEEAASEGFEVLIF